MKAKKKIDVSIIKAREEKKKKKIEKLLKKRLRLNKEEKPIEENEIPICLMEDNKQQRSREINISENVLYERMKILREWSKVKSNEMKSDIMLINRLITSQKQALNELRLESEELYQAAVRIDEKLIPFQFNGPSETPPLENYPICDGEYIDISKKWL
ncbi:mitochondrial 50S ribosomal protein L40, putative [Pediculus humanus corporis]|uniref:Large ribosomal subunit protein mL40 n=1 Tax=Pediculus humanus subsp. corporis TaxID=121224 RepID=E0VV88_PEDHC|nr:mitochondrial 50S ribosomal protein L40, putative [Pediculus humanus corporis]EEB17294.1 mitochondrial 50S ribosomal protein L40, putative [Pediculus humanus corporis]